MLRAILVLVAIVLLVVIALAYTGVIAISETQEGQTPKFEVEVKDVDVGTTTKNVAVPTIGTKTKQVEVPTVSVANGAASNAQ